MTATFALPVPSTSGSLEQYIQTVNSIPMLTAEEEKCVKWSNKSNNEDILDAIGIGLWHFGRLNQKVYPGAGK